MDGYKVRLESVVDNDLKISQNEYYSNSLERSL